jgi:ADP-heptose:LPS heptosyltransferase
MIEHMGDIIAQEPISRLARYEYPNSKTIWFVKKPYISLLKHNPYIDIIITVPCLSTWIWIKNKIKFDFIYEMHLKGRFCPKCKIPLNKDIYDENITGLNYFNYGGLLKSSCLHNKINFLNIAPEIYLPSELSIKSMQSLEKYIVLHCKSNEEIKDWENHKWEKLIDLILSNSQLQIIEVGSKSTLNVINERYKNLCGKLSILETAELIKNALLFCGIDSGPAHIANAVGTPGVLLFGEYFYEIKNQNPYTGNYGENLKCRFIRSQGFVKDIEIHAVFDAINDFLPIKKQ